MNLLIINYEMNDESPVLAWQASVARHLSKECTKVVVLSEKVGKFESSANMEVGILPHRRSSTSDSFNPAHLPSALSSLDTRAIDVCFIHMAHRWSYTLYPHLRARNIPILLWYAHGSVTPHLHRAHSVSRRVITSTSEGFRIPSSKVFCIGQGINTKLFYPPVLKPIRNTILYTGRISRRKRIHLLIEVLAELHRRGNSDISLRIIGPLLTADDEKYLTEVKHLISSLRLDDSVSYVGSLPQEQHAEHYSDCFLHLNVSLTGSMDKTVLEALACGCPVLTNNLAFKQFLQGFKEMFIESDIPQDIVERVEIIKRSSYPPQDLRGLIINSHDESSYSRSVLFHLKELHEAALTCH